MENHNEHFQRTLLFSFWKKEVMRRKWVKSNSWCTRQERRCFIETRLPKNGLQNFVLVISMLKEPRSGRPVEIDSDEMKALVDENRRYATRDVAKISNVSKSSVANHLEAFGYVGKLDVWTARQLKEARLVKRVTNVRFTFETRGKRSIFATYDNRRWKLDRLR